MRRPPLWARDPDAALEERREADLAVVPYASGCAGCAEWLFAAGIILLFVGVALRIWGRL